MGKKSELAQRLLQAAVIATLGVRPDAKQHESVFKSIDTNMQNTVALLVFQVTYNKETDAFAANFGSSSSHVVFEAMLACLLAEMEERNEALEASLKNTDVDRESQLLRALFALLGDASPPKRSN